MSFLRAEDCICGTTTTSTGTLTLAACPAPPGGVDPYAAFSGLGLGTSQSIPMTYCVREFTDSTFTTVKQEEKGIGALTIGANIGATTLARTTPQSTATNCNTSTPTYSQGAPSAINIGVAANILVFVGASAADIQAWSPYFDTSLTNADNVGVTPALMGVATAASANLVSGTDYYMPFPWEVPMLVKKATFKMSTVYSGGTPVSNAYARIYALGSNGRPGKLLIDFGLLGTANASLNAAGNVSSAVASPGYMLLPGKYVMGFLPIFSGGTTPPQMSTIAYGHCSPFGTSSLTPINFTTATGGSNPAPDPANATGYVAGGSGATRAFQFALSPS